MSKFCSSCGTELEEGTKFCNNCGKPQEGVQTVVANDVNPINSEESGKTTGVKTDGLSITSFVLSLVGLLIFGFICGILSLTMGIVGLKRTRVYGTKGRGLAIAGIAIGAFDLVAVIFYAIVRVAAGF